MDKYVLQLGSKCNNNCIHCVMKQENKLSNKPLIYPNYKNIMDNIHSIDFAKAKCISVTGGEPTIRPEFSRIIKSIISLYPQKKISLQTNGQNLHNFKELILEHKYNFSVTMSFYSVNKELYNKIAQPFSPDAYENTYKSIDFLIKENIHTIIEFVLIKDVLSDIVNSVIELNKKGIKNFCFSYPHMPLYKLKSDLDNYMYPIENLIDIFKSFDEKLIDGTNIYLEAIPYCIYKKNNRLNFLDIEANRSVIMNKNNKNIEVNQNIFYTKASECKNCIYINKCNGTWKHGFDLYNNNIFKLKEV